MPDPFALPAGGPVVRLAVGCWMPIWSSLRGGAGRTVLAAAYDLKVFFAVVARAPDEVCPTDVLGFITAQRTGRIGEHAVVQVG